MSEERQQQPAPVNQMSPETNEQSTETTKSTENIQSVSEAETIERLRGTIRQLEEILDKLDARPGEYLLPVASVENLAASTQELAASLEKAEIQPATTAEEVIEQEAIAQPATSEIPEDTATATPVPEVPPAITAVEETEEELPSQPSWLDRVLPSFSSLQVWWDGTLEKVRSLLPAPLKEKLSDWALTGILAGIVVVLLLTSVLLLPQQPKEVVEIPPEEIEMPPELTAPGAPQPMKPAPPPKLELTPEQSLIAAIQNQVAEITNQYAEGLILSIETNFLESRLIVTVGDDWYDLSDSRQDKLANEMLRHSQKLDFRKLAITDTEGTLLARSPVVGKKMVILQREKLTAQSRSGE